MKHDRKKKIIDTLTRLGWNEQMSANAAYQMLRDAGVGFRRQDVFDAIRPEGARPRGCRSTADVGHRLSVEQRRLDEMSERLDELQRWLADIEHQNRPESPSGRLA